MGKNIGETPLILAVALFLILAGAAVSLWKISSVELRKGDFWQKYYGVVTSDPSVAEKGLDERGIPYLSREKSLLRYNDVPEIVTVPLTNAAKRFDPADPRFDPYMRKVDRLFQASGPEGNEEIIYVQSDSISLFALHHLLSDLYGRGEAVWNISGFEPANYLGPVLLYAVFLPFFILFVRRFRLRSVLGHLSWLPLVYLGGYPLCAIALLSLYLSHLGEKGVFPFVPYILVALYLWLGHGAVSPGLVLALIPPAGGILLLNGIPGPQEKKKVKEKKRKFRLRKPEHTLFEPVPIMAPEEEKTTPHFVLRIASLIILVSASLLTLVSRPLPYHSLPLPAMSPDEAWNLEGAGGTFGKGDCVTPGDYIAHTAFQEGLLYRRVWEYPSVSSPLTFPVFQKENNKFSKSLEIIESYSDKWFSERISLLKNNNPAKILFSTVHPRIVKKNFDQPINHPFPLLQFSLIMLVLGLLIFAERKKSIDLNFSVRIKLLRRNERVA